MRLLWLWYTNAMNINRRCHTVQVGEQEIRTWPDNLAINLFSQGPNMGAANFKDTDKYHPGLLALMGLLETQEDMIRNEAGLLLVDELINWDVPEADLINSRALKFVQAMMNRDSVTYQSAQAVRVLANADAVLKAPCKATAGVIYVLQADELAQRRMLAGSLRFALGQHSTNLPPSLAPGTMIAYPASLNLHISTPHGGDVRLLQWFYS